MIDKSRSRAFHRPFYDVDVEATFEAGMVATLTTSPTGEGTVATLAGSGNVPLGIFWNSKSTIFVKTSIETASFPSGKLSVELAHEHIVSGTVRVTSADGGTVYTEGTDYTIDYTKGIITRVAGGNIPDGATVIVTYRYDVPQRDLQFYGVGYDRIPDDTIGSGKITVVEGYSQLYIDVFDTLTSYSLGDALGANASGILTNQSPTYAFAKVISVPTANDPWLGIETTTIVS